MRLKLMILFLFAVLFASAENQDPTQSVCVGNIKNYHVDATVGSTYNWTVTPSVAGVSVTGTGNSSQVTWGTAGVYTLKVVETNQAGCVGAEKQVVVTVNAVPSATITGVQSLCEDGTETYSASNLTGATYVWTVPAGATLNSGSGTNQISVTWGTPGSISLGLTVTKSGCSASSSLAVTVWEKPTPVVSGLNGLCLNAAEIYSTTSVSGNTYSWTLPGNAMLVSGQNTASITVTWSGIGTGVISVLESNSHCSNTASLSVTVAGPPTTTPIWHD